MSSEPVPGTDEVVRLDRRHRRREETIEQVVDVAASVMAEQGAAGLSLGEVARRVGIRTPSLYVYFDSKNALYDAVFERGWRDVQRTFAALPDPPADAAEASTYLLMFAQAIARWAVEHQAYAQLLFWRPVPGYEPSAAAYVPAIEVMEGSRERMARIRDLGWLRADVDIDRALQLWTVLIAGVVSQQLANAPHESFEEGSFTSALPELVAMFLEHFGTEPTVSMVSQRKSSPSKGRRTHAVKSRSDR